MSKRIVIVGTGMQAELAQFYFAGQDGRVVDAYVVDPQYLAAPAYLGRPVLDFAQMQRHFPPATHEVFIAIGMTATQARKRWAVALREAGYGLASFVHASAWVAGNATVGAGTLIKERAVVAPYARIGENVILCPQVQVSHHTRIGAHGFLAPAVVVGGAVEVGECCFLGINAIVRDRVRIGEGCIIGAGAVVMADCAPRGVYRAVRTERTRDVEGD